jgi:hypothetical protein
VAQGLTLSPKLIYFEPIRAKLQGIKKMQLVHTSMVYVWSGRTFFYVYQSSGFGSLGAQLCKQDLGTMASHNPLQNPCKDQVVECV